MFRSIFIASAALFTLQPLSVYSQRSFPSPSSELHDVKFKFYEPNPNGADHLVTVNGHMVGYPRTPTQINSLVMSRDNKLVAAGKQYGRLVIWDVESKQLLCAIDTGYVAVGRIAISPDNQFIAAAATNGKTIKTWHIPDGKLVTTFENATGNVLGLFYSSDPNLLITFSAETYLYDVSTGALTKRLDGEKFPVLSTDGSTLLTRTDAQVVLRNTHDWAIEKTLPLLTKTEWPVFLDSDRGLYLFEDMWDDHLFVAVQTSDGQMLPGAKLANLPKEPLGPGDFAATDPTSGLVFGHSGGRLWILNLKTGKTCLSEQLFSNSGALSIDGKLLVGAFDSDTPTDNQNHAGIDIWKTEDLLKPCRMQ